MSAPHVVVGIDVSKAQLDVALRPTEDWWHVSNEAWGITGWVERLQAVQPTRSVVEATGGLEGPAAGALAEAGLPVVVVNPRHARDVAKATGRLAKTARLEREGWRPVRWRCGRRRGPGPRRRHKRCVPC